MKTSIVSLGLFKHAGGPSKTIDAFKLALDAELYAFCKSSTLRKYQLSVKDVHRVVSSSFPLLSHFCYPKRGVKEAEEVVRQSDLVSCHGFYRYHTLWTQRICKAAGIPYWFVPHGILDPWVMKKNRLVKQLYWRFGGHQFLQRASTVIFSTTTERDKAASQFDLPGAEVVPWPVELVDITLQDEKRVQIRKKLGIPKGAHILLYFGRVHSMKRPFETIEALAHAKTSNTHLLIVGNEDDITKDECIQIARKYGIEKRVHWIGSVYGDNKYHYMHAADAYISLSYRENFNHTAAESLAAGLPVILSPGNDLRSELSDVKCCLKIEDETLQSAIKAIQNFNNLDLSELQEMGMRGRKWVEGNLSFDLFKRRLIQLHEKYAKK